jgi:cytochrome c-type biogenesis protein CcmH
MRHHAITVALSCLLTLSARAVTDDVRQHALAAELRCPVCQNQSLADSDAELAADLRVTIRQQIEAGRSDAEIRRFMVDRYGEFVLYDPPFAAHTVLLWVGPFGVLSAAAIALWWRVGRRWQAARKENEG